MKSEYLTDDGRVNIPENVREFLHLEPGMKLKMVVFEHLIELVPIREKQESHRKEVHE